MSLETTETTTEVQQSVVLTDGAAAKVKGLLDQEGRDDLRCASPCSRAAARACATSCSSTSARSTATHGHRFRRHRAGGRPDVRAVPGRRDIDFVDTIEKQGFTIDNPNAQNSCACGDSFH